MDTLKILVESTEQYSFLDTTAKNNSKELFFANFTLGSIAHIGIWTVSSQDQTHSIPRLYTTFYGGVAESYLSSITNNETKNTGISLTNGSVILWRIFQERFVQSGILDEFSEKYGIYNLKDWNLENHEFLSVLVACFVIILSFRVFMSREWTAIFTGFLLSLLLWLVTNITVNVNWIVIFICFAFFTWMVAKRKLFVGILLLLASMLILPAYYFLSIKYPIFGCVVSTRNLFCSPITIPAGLIFWYGFLVLYLLFTEMENRKSFEK
jgi:hypothetical protein